MNIYLGADHQAFYLLDKVSRYLEKHGNVIVNDNKKNADDDDVIEFAHKAVVAVNATTKHDVHAIVLCGDGQGVTIAMNRFRGIRAVVIRTIEEAKKSRHDLDCNILCLPADIMKDDSDNWKQILDACVHTPFSKAPRHVRRNMELDEVGL